MLCWRELVRFFRQRHRVIGAIGQPIIFWLLFGAGLHRTFRLSSDLQAAPTFLEYFLPGTVVLIILFTAIFATISIIEDRREGFLQSVLVAPIPAWSMVLGKVAGGSAIALIHAALFLGLAMLLPVSLSVWGVLAAAPMMALCAVALTALGFALAWRMDSSQGFHAVMSLVLLPMWLLSGGFFPVPPASPQEPLAQYTAPLVHACEPVDVCRGGDAALALRTVGFSQRLGTFTCRLLGGNAHLHRDHPRRRSLGQPDQKPRGFAVSKKHERPPRACPVR